MRKIRNKPSSVVLAKQRARFELKYTEFSANTLEELKEIYQKQKMSSTDKKALEYAAMKKLDEIKVEDTTKVAEEDGN